MANLTVQDAGGYLAGALKISGANLGCDGAGKTGVAFLTGGFPPVNTVSPGVQFPKGMQLQLTVMTNAAGYKALAGEANKEVAITLLHFGKQDTSKQPAEPIITHSLEFTKATVTTVGAMLPWVGAQTDAEEAPQQVNVTITVGSGSVQYTMDADTSNKSVTEVGTAS